MFFTAALQVVYKTTGGRIWNKRWGLPRLSRTRKENRKKDVALFNQNLNVLKAAAHLQPDVPVRLSRTLQPWQVQLMRERLEHAQQQINLRDGGAAAGVLQPRWRRQPPLQQAEPQLPAPPVDPQAQTRLNQQAVTALRQQRAAQQQRSQQQQQQVPQPERPQQQARQ